MTNKNKLNFEQFLFDDFECLLQFWSKETNSSFLKEESDGDTEYIYDSKAFRKCYHENKLQIEREIQLNSILNKFC